MESQPWKAPATFALEKFYDWNGICIDPNPSFLKSLCGSRDVLISDLAVWQTSGEILDFKYIQQGRKDFFGWNFRSGISSVVDNTLVKFDDHKVFSITLNDLLELYNAPKDIDYISIDEEEFHKTIDSFRSPHLWGKDQLGNWKLRHNVAKTGLDD